MLVVSILLNLFANAESITGTWGEIATKQTWSSHTASTSGAKSAVKSIWNADLKNQFN